MHFSGELWFPTKGMKKRKKEQSVMKVDKDKDKLEESHHDLFSNLTK